jgi:N-acyl-D-aspartate/D-glutamate deacylase
MSRTIIRDCRVWDGSGKTAFPADLLTEDGCIRAVARNRDQLDGADVEVIEAGGLTLMPGLLEGHAHFSFGNAVRCIRSARKISANLSPVGSV